MTLRRRFRDSQNGFTLVEVLMAMAIIAILFPFLIGIFTGARATVKDGEFELIATRLAEDVMEEARALARDRMLHVDSFDGYELGEEYQDTYSREIEVQGPGGGIPDHTFRVTVTVRWDRASGTGSLTLTSLIYQH